MCQAIAGVVDQVGGFRPMGALRRCESVDENADRSDMRKQGIGENTGTGD